MYIKQKAYFIAGASGHRVAQLDGYPVVQPGILHHRISHLDSQLISQASNPVDQPAGLHIEVEHIHLHNFAGTRSEDTMCERK